MPSLQDELMNSLSSYETGRELEISRNEKGEAVIGPSQEAVMRITKLRAPMRQAEPQTFAETAKDIPTAVGGGAAGAIAGTFGLPGDVVGILKGAYDAANPEVGEGRFEAFMSGLEEVSSVAGSEAIKNVMRDMTKDLPEEQKKTLEDAMLAGEFVGVGSAIKKAPKAVSALGDAVEGAGDAAKARMADADGSVTLGMNIDPDPAIAAAGDAVKAARAKYEASPNDPNARRTYLEARRQRDDKIAKFKAPTETEPGIIAFHGSGKDFDEFLLKYIGTGAKATQYGYGLYFSDFEDVATYFRGIASPNLADYKLNNMSVNDMYNRAQNTEDYEKAEVLEQVLLHDRPDEISKRFTVEEGYSPETQEFASSINYDTLKGIDPDGNEVSLGRTYKVELGINKDNMLDWQEPLKNQPDDIIQKVRSLVDEDLRDTFDNNVEKGIAGGNAYLNYIGKNKKEASEKLAALGIDGIKYKDIGGTLGYTLENAPTNYVVFNPQAIKILEKYGIVGPVAITGVAATQQEGESDGTRA